MNFIPMALAAHEHAGMVGRIVVGTPSGDSYGADVPAPGLSPLPEIALAAFPAVGEIAANGIVRRT